MNDYVDFKSLLGKTMTQISGAVKDSEVIDFVTDDGKKFRLFHQSDCCEVVAVNDVCGEVSDLIGTPILQAEESSNSDPITGVSEHCDSFTFTFYRLATIKGAVTIRWLGESNGYYSESVDFVKL